MIGNLESNIIAKSIWWKDETLKKNITFEQLDVKNFIEKVKIKLNKKSSFELSHENQQEIIVYIIILSF